MKVRPGSLKRQKKKNYKPLLARFIKKKKKCGWGGRGGISNKIRNESYNQNHKNIKDYKRLQ